MTRAALADPGTSPQSPALVWKRLAPLVAASGRSRMRLWNPDTEKFSDTAKRTDRLPSRPAAVYLYTRKRTQLLWLDFDSKRWGPKAVDADMATAAAWLTECGGIVVTDHSTSGGAHLLCPLAIGTTASHDEMVQLVRLLSARLPTLDITPNTNAETGCMTPPGSPCREGGYRTLDCSLDAAVEAFTTRSAPDLLPRLYMLLGALNPSPRRNAQDTPSSAATLSYTVGSGDDKRLAPHHVRHDPLPTDVANYAARGEIAPTRPTWKSNHEARMSVITQAIARGHSLNDVRHMVGAGGPWEHGLGQAYQRYHHRSADALERDFAKALAWLTTNVLDSSPPRHKIKYSPGGQRGGPRGPKDLRNWLANAMAWADREFTGKRYRWTVHAVLQTLAFYAAVAGEHRSGTYLVGVGGRTLSIGCGLLSEDTVWRVLADLRDRPGAPLVLVRRHIGTEADVYALTSQNRVTTDRDGSERVRIEPVHDAWIVLGHHLRRIYELVAHHGLTRKADLYAAARVPRATGDAMVIELEIAGLLQRSSRGNVTRGQTELDTIAERHRLIEYRRERHERHQAERAAWKSWLASRHHHAEALPAPEPPSMGGPGETSIDSAADAYLSAVMATGPPPRDDIEFEHWAIDLISELLGAHIIAANPTS